MHKYITPSGFEVPGGSTIAHLYSDGSDGLVKWGAKLAIEAVKNGMTPEDAINAPEKEKERAATVGTAAHALVENVILDNLGLPQKEFVAPEGVDISQSLLAFDSWMKWWSSITDIQLICAEEDCASDFWLVGGQIDAMARIGGKLVLLDWKTSNHASIGHEFQTAIYVMLYEEKHNVEIDEVRIVYIKKDGSHAEEVVMDKEKIKHRKDAAKLLIELFYLAKNRRLKNNPRCKQPKKKEKKCS